MFSSTFATLQIPIPEPDGDIVEGLTVVIAGVNDCLSGNGTLGVCCPSLSLFGEASRMGGLFLNEKL